MQQAAHVPLYMDWSFWAVVVAAAALILSQLPPLHQLFRKAKLDIEPYSRIHIGHKVGNPNVSLHLILTNVGGRSVRVKSITLTIRRDGKEVSLLPAQAYFQNPNDKSTVLFTAFSLKPREEWVHVVSFLNFFSREDEKKYKESDSKLRAAISEKRKALGEKNQLVEAESELVVPFIEMFNQKFIWHPGEYQVQINVLAANSNVSLQKNYRLTLFETDAAELIKAKDDYKLGDGIFWDSGNHPGVLVQFAEA